jgi:hypothetical protein
MITRRPMITREPEPVGSRPASGDRLAMAATSGSSR